ncbi:DUF1998 domain-containing protein [Streptomyces sp. NPDC023998]|uniref:DUF1998 domain-containing protein n=1 Tax=Streptomyces sp. NPDC023998 TaxID=3154597 RepID=UPI0033C5CBAB
MTTAPRRSDRASRLARLGSSLGPRRRGSARRAQMITTYGVGSMIAIDSESFVLRGIDSWRVPDEFGITEPRLQNQLDVDGFHLPPAADDNNTAKDGARIARFPEWYSCSKCRDLNEHYRLVPDRKSNKCGKCETTELTPSRFVQVCENGHLDDFPYWRWVHNRTEPSGGEGTHHLTLHTTGRTAALRSIEIHCSCGKKQSLEGALSSKALQSLGISCSGKRPWLKDGELEGCTATPRAIQRGASVAWFPHVESALTIPPWSEGANKLIRPFISRFRGFTDDAIQTYISMTPSLAKSGYSTQDLLAAVNIAQRAMDATTATEEDASAATPHDPMRRDEYAQLQRATVPDSRVTPDFECAPAGALGDIPDRTGIDMVMLVPRLREVRALTSFTRLKPPTRANADRWSPLSKNPQGWLPAIEVIGEGVFLRLSQDQVAAWEQQKAVRERSERIRRQHTALLKEQAGPEGTAEDSPVSARQLLLHTLAHALINEWSLDCGYPASALRERLYVDDEMLGVLIYTATSDSAGSLGGLVGCGSPSELDASLGSAMQRARWCSADPLCIESNTTGADNVNLAACHCCVLLAETSCETFNRFLDRATLIGTPENPEIGFFHKVD